MLQKIIGQFTRDERLYDDEKIKNLAKKFPSENSPDGQRMIMYMLLFSWYTRNTVLPFTADQIVSLVDSIIDVYYNQEYQQMNNIMISLIRNDLQRMSFWSNEYVFKTFFNDDFIVDDGDQMYVNLEKLSIFNKWILQSQHNVEFYNYSHLLVQKCKHNNKYLQYVHNYTIMVSDDVPQNIVQIHCPKCDILTQIPKDDFLKMCRNYEKSSAKFSQGISIYCHKCDTQINFIRLYGDFKVLYGGVGDGFQPYEGEEQEEQYGKQGEQKVGEAPDKVNIKCDEDTELETRIQTRQNAIKQGEQAEWNSLQTLFEQFGAVVQNNDMDWTYQKAQEWYEAYVKSVFNVTDVSNQFSCKTGECFVLNLQGGERDDYLQIIFDYFVNQQAQHTDVFYYSGKLFADKINLEVEKLSEKTKEKLEELRKCLEFVQSLLQQNELTLTSDRINKDKLQKSNYKLLKLFNSSNKQICNNDYYKTIYFVSNSNLKSKQESKPYRQNNTYNQFSKPYRSNNTYNQFSKPYWQNNTSSYFSKQESKPQWLWLDDANGQNCLTFTTQRATIQYISLCHGGIVIQISSNGESHILRSMIETIKYLLGEPYDSQQLKLNMIRFIISIAILSKYEKDAFDNNAKSRKSTLRDDYNCVMNKNDTTGQSHSFYNTFMQLYYGMLLWDETQTNPIEVDTSYDNQIIIEIIKATFIEFYTNLKYNANNGDDDKLVFDTGNGNGIPLNNKYLSFLMTLYTYDCYIEKIFDYVYRIPDTKNNQNKRKMCYCLIKWIQKFVLHMLVNVYRYNLTNLEKVKKTFQEESKTIGNRESKCLLDQTQFEKLKKRWIQRHNFFPTNNISCMLFFDKQMYYIPHIIETGFSDQEENSPKLMMNKYELYGFVNVLKKLLGREISEDEISLIRIFNKSYREYTYFYPILTFHNSDSVFTNWVVVMQKVLQDYVFEQRVLDTQNIQSADDVHNMYSFIQDIYINIFLPLYNTSRHKIPEYEYSRTILQECFQNGVSTTLLEDEKEIDYQFEVMGCLNYDEFHSCYHIVDFVEYKQQVEQAQETQNEQENTQQTQKPKHRHCSICGDSDEQISQRPNGKEMVCFNCCKDKPDANYFCQRCLVAYLRLNNTTHGRYSHEEFVEIVVCPSCRCFV